ncbi:MAG: PDZ domain-containing protein [Phycisphaerae bacterium]
MTGRLKFTARPWLAALLLGLSAVAWSQTTAPVPPPTPPAPAAAPGAAPPMLQEKETPTDVTAATAQLADPVCARRQTAENMLMRQAPTILPQLATALRQTNDLEQVARLHQIAAHLALKSQNVPEGQIMLGVTMVAEPSHPDLRGKPVPPTVRIQQTQLGFPGAEYLEQNDQILTIDGTPLPEESTVEEFRRQVLAHHLGQQVTLRIIRGLRELTIRVPLTYAIAPEEAGNSLAARLQLRAEQARHWAAEVLDDQRASLPPVVFPDSVPAPPPRTGSRTGVPSPKAGPFPEPQDPPIKGD